MRPLLRKAIPGLIALGMFGLALTVLGRELEGHSLGQILSAIRAIPLPQVGLAFLLTALSYVVLSGYDFLGSRYVGRPIPWPRAALASFLGYSFSNALGFPILTGAPVRFRLYGGWGFSVVEITRIVAFYTATYALGFLTLAGLLGLVAGGETGGSALPIGGRLTGVALLLPTVAYLAWAASSTGAPARLRSFEFPRPGRRLSLAQVALSAADWTVAAGVLFVLLPAGSLPYWIFLGVFLVSQIAGVLSQVPGGLGVFEALIVAALPDTASEPAILAALLAYRAIYHLLPLLLAASTVAVWEAVRRREAVEALQRGLSATAPLAFGAAVVVAGSVLLIWGALPVPVPRLALIGRLLPLPVLELSHFLASLSGAALLILSWGLYRRLDAAYHLTLALLGAATVLSLMRGSGPLPIVTTAVALAVLVPARREFFRKASILSEPLSREWVTLVVVVLAATAWLGFFAHRNVDYRSELWWQFALRGDAPRFLRAMVGSAVLVFLFAASRLLRPAEADPPTPAASEIPQPVVEAVAGSPRANARLALLGDKAFLLSKSRRSFVMYGVEGRSWVSMGDPVGEADEAPELVWRFRKSAFRYDGWPVFYQVAPGSLPVYVEAGLALIKIGEEGRVPLAGFSLDGSGRAGFRKTLRRTREAGAVFEVVPAGETTGLIPELRRVSDAWLAAKGAREKGFSLGRFDDAYLSRLPVAVVRVEGRIVAFADVWLGGQQEEMSPDLMRYAPDEAPKGVMEYLFVELMLWGAANDYRWFGLGMAPLAGLDDRPLSPLWSRLGAAVFRYGEHFYNFQGLRAYKEKFDPEWEPRYVASPGGLALPRILANVATLVGGGVRGIVKS